MRGGERVQSRMMPLSAPGAFTLRLHGPPLLVIVLFKRAYGVAFEEWFVTHKRQTPSCRDRRNGVTGGMP
jgi:hypothetical protein